jgi:hypothetical protein
MVDGTERAGRGVAGATIANERPAPLTIEEASKGLFASRFRVLPPEVVFVKGVLEASEGIANVFAERGGELVIAAPAGREQELLELLRDLARETGGELEAGGGRVQDA